MNQMRLVFLHGAPAVGKLTVARELAALTGFRLFHNHLTVDLASSLFSFGSEPFILLREKIWLAAFAEAGHGAAIVPATFRGKGERVQIARLELRRKPVTMPLAILWDDNKPLPRFAENFPELFSAHATALIRDGDRNLSRSQVR